jgi:hypothetical protein
LTASVTVATAAAASLPVVVTNPNGQASNSVALSVTAPAAAATIGSLSPNPMTGSNSAQLLSVNGSGFQPGLKLSIGGTTILASQLASLTSTQLQLYLITGLAAHTFAVQVVNPNAAASNTANLQVNAPPAPAIGSLSPNPFTHSTSTQVLTVNGANFQSGTGLQVTVGGVLYTGNQVTVVSASQLKVMVVIPSAGPEPVQVIDPSGAASNMVSLTVK